MMSHVQQREMIPIVSMGICYIFKNCWRTLKGMLFLQNKTGIAWNTYFKMYPQIIDIEVTRNKTLSIFLCRPYEEKAIHRDCFVSLSRKLNFTITLLLLNIYSSKFQIILLMTTQTP